MKQILHTKYNNNLAWLLMLLIVVQNLLPLQTHTKAVVTDSGRTVIMCTLDGLKSIILDKQGHVSDETVQQHNALSAAIQFSELMASATTAVKSLQISTTFIPSLTLATFISVYLKINSNRFQLIRAPPFS